MRQRRPWEALQRAPAQALGLLLLLLMLLLMLMLLLVPLLLWGQQAPLGETRLRRLQRRRRGRPPLRR